MLSNASVAVALAYQIIDADGAGTREAAVVVPQNVCAAAVGAAGNSVIVTTTGILVLSQMPIACDT
ncbi:hypothetical protein D9M72_392730 [compost metagenome]